MIGHRCGIELRHLRYFLASVEHGSFRRAGVALDVRGSTISRQVRDLEDRLGASLLHRHKCGVRLTLAGERFLDRARAAMLDIGVGARDVAAIGRVDRGHIKIGTIAGAISPFLLNLLRSYDRAHPGVDIDLIDGESVDQIAALRRRDIDVAFVVGSEGWDGCETMALWTEPVVVVLPDSHPLVGQPELQLHHLAGEYFIGDQAAWSGLDHVSKEWQVSKVARFVISSWLSRRHLSHLPLVALGRGVMLTCATKVAPNFPGVAYRPILGEVLPFSAVWLPGNDNPALRRLLATARTQSDRSR